MGLTLEHIYLRDVFEDLTFTFETGKMTLLIGDTGAGKSTLFRILTNFNELDFAGEVKLGNTLLSHLPIHERVTYLSMMFQNPNHQFTMTTLYEELIFTLENLQTPAEQIDEKIKHAVTLGKVEHLLHRNFLTLSGGEKQQVSLAILLAMDSQIILLDEPFASVDQVARKRLIHLLADLTKMGKTVILCDHDHSLYADYVDCLVELKNGKLFEQDVALLKKAHPSYQLVRKNTQRSPLLQLQHVSCQFDKKYFLQLRTLLFSKVLRLSSELTVSANPLSFVPFCNCKNTKAVCVIRAEKLRRTRSYIAILLPLFRMLKSNSFGRPPQRN